MTNNTQQRDEDDVTARSREAKRALEARARNQDTQIAQMHATMLQQQEQMRLHQQEMLRQRNEMATMARYQGNGNNQVNFGQQVLDAAGLAFGDASIPDNLTWLEMMPLARIMEAQGGMRWMLMICKCFGISPDDVALERVVVV
jgi:hypothetical protein